MKIVGYQNFSRITRFVTLVIRPDSICLRSTPVHRPSYKSGNKMKEKKEFCQLRNADLGTKVVFQFHGKISTS